MDETTAGSSSSRLVSWAGPEAFSHAMRSGRYQNGLELLRAMRDGEIPRPPIAELIDYFPVEIEEGMTIFECTPQVFHYNPNGVAHGGVVATLLDTAMACAIHTRLPISAGYTTLELKVNFVRPLTVATGPVRAQGSVLHLGKRTATADGRLEDGDGKLLAHASTTCLILT